MLGYSRVAKTQLQIFKKKITAIIIMVKKITLREAYLMFRWLNFKFLKHVKIPLKLSVSIV